MILFLDFDGVLHPAHDGEPTPAEEVFCNLPRFESVMRDYQQVEIVISSMWRYQFSLAELCARFSPDIASRIIGATLLYERIEGKYLSARREGELLDWLAAAGRLYEPWVALDDADWQFIKYRERLVECIWYIGFDSVAETRLRAALENCMASAKVN
jgi:hypothetical protein